MPKTPRKISKMPLFVDLLTRINFCFFHLIKAVQLDEYCARCSFVSFFNRFGKFVWQTALVNANKANWFNEVFSVLFPNEET